MLRVSLRLVLVLVAMLAGWCLVPPAAASSEDALKPSLPLYTGK